MEWRRFVTYLSNDPRTYKVSYLPQTDRASALTEIFGQGRGVLTL